MEASADGLLYFLSCPDAVARSVPAETETTTASEEIPAPVESEEPSDTKQAAEDVSTDASPAEPTASLELETLEAAPVEAAPVESAPSSEEQPAPKASDEPAGTKNILPHKSLKCCQKPWKTTVGTKNDPIIVWKKDCESYLYISCITSC